MYHVVLVPNSPHNDNGRQRKENLELLAKKASIIGHLGGRARVPPQSRRSCSCHRHDRRSLLRIETLPDTSLI